MPAIIRRLTPAKSTSCCDSTASNLENSAHLWLTCCKTWLGWLIFFTQNQCALYCTKDKNEARFVQYIAQAFKWTLHLPNITKHLKWLCNPDHPHLGRDVFAVQYALNYSSPMFLSAVVFSSNDYDRITDPVSFKKHHQTRPVCRQQLRFTIMLGYGSQTIGLQSISSSESAFLTALYVPLVPDIYCGWFSVNVLMWWHGWGYLLPLSV